MNSRMQDVNSKHKIKLTILGEGQLFGDDDVILKRNYSCTLKCIQNDSEAYLISRHDFLRLFKGNEEAWRLMFESASQKEE
jgi:CRP-like cAMP-binding protein